MFEEYFPNGEYEIALVAEFMLADESLAVSEQERVKMTSSITFNLNQ
ncbi:MAG TPA: hypothetical protein GX525_02680 [Bacilli bacterium]|nr:hypothetical protein [Bacilli bacterium]